MSSRATKNPPRSKSKSNLAHREPWWRSWPIFLLLAVVTFATFAPLCAAEFLYWDDNINVWKNSLITSPTLGGVLEFWKAPFLDLYVPVTYTAWAILSLMAAQPTRDTRGNHLDPAVFHTSNILLHIVSACLVFAILRRLIGKKWPAAAALLFALHPIQVEAVAWVTGLKDVLCGVLSLAAIWQYITFAQGNPGLNETHARRRWIHYGVSILFFILAMLAKPSAVTIPLIVFAIDAWLVRKSWRKAFACVVPMLVLAAVGVLAAMRFQPVIASADEGHKLLRPLLASDSLAFYLYKLVVPISFGVQYNRAPMTVIHHGWLYYTWIAPAALAVAALVRRKRAAWLLVAVVIFFVCIGPVSGIVPFSFQRYADVADRYMYVAMLGAGLALAGLLAWLSTGSNRRTVTIIVAGALFLLAVRSFARTIDWRTNDTLFRSELAFNPDSALAYMNLAGDMAELPTPHETPAERNDRLSRAKVLAEKAVTLSPDSPDGYLTLGSIEHDMGDSGAALAAFEKAADLGPSKAEALDSYGGALAERGKPNDLPKAEMLLRRALRINPRFSLAHLNLGILLAHEHGDKDETALSELQKAVHFDEANPIAHRALANVLAAQRGTADDAALHEALTAVELSPNDLEAQRLLLKMYMDRRDATHALERAEIVLRLSPTDAYARKAHQFLTGR